MEQVLASELFMGGMQVVNHEIERGIVRNDLLFPHEGQVRAAAHFIHGNLGSVE